MLALYIFTKRAKKHSSITTPTESYLPFIGHSWVAFQNIRNNVEHDWISSIANKYKWMPFSLSYLSRNHVFIHSPKLIQYLFSHHSKSLLKTKEEYMINYEMTGKGILHSNGPGFELHSKQMTAYLTSPQFLSFFFHVINNDAQKCVSKILDLQNKKQKQQSNNSLRNTETDNNFVSYDGSFVNMHQMFLRSILNGVCRMFIGTDFNILSSIPNMNVFARCYSNMIRYCNARTMNPFWLWFRYLNFGTEKELYLTRVLLDQIIGTVLESKKISFGQRSQTINKTEKEFAIWKRKSENEKYSTSSIKQRMERKENEKNISTTKNNNNGIMMGDSKSKKKMNSFDFTDSDLVSYYFKSVNADISLQELRDNVCNIIIASRDDLAILLSWFVYQISLPANHAIYHRIKREIAGISDLNLQSLKQLKYLQKCLLETLRLYPSKPYIVRQLLNDINVEFVEDKKENLICNCTLFKNDYLVIHNYSMGRAEWLWKNPLVFNPQRMPNNIFSNAGFQFQFPAFGVGKHRCLGITSTMIAAKIYIFHLLKNHDLVAKVNQNVKYDCNGPLYMKNGFYAKLVQKNCK